MRKAILLISFTLLASSAVAEEGQKLSAIEPRVNGWSAAHGGAR